MTLELTVLGLPDLTTKTEFLKTSDYCSVINCTFIFWTTNVFEPPYPPSYGLNSFYNDDFGFK